MRSLAGPCSAPGAMGSNGRQRRLRPTSICTMRVILCFARVASSRLRQPVTRRMSIAAAHSIAEPCAMEKKWWRSRRVRRAQPSARVSAIEEDWRVRADRAVRDGRPSPARGPLRRIRARRESTSRRSWSSNGAVSGAPGARGAAGASVAFEGVRFNAGLQSKGTAPSPSSP
jgi:hypothetical protein